MFDPQALADTLVEVTPPEYVRFVAHWLTQATDVSEPARPTGDPVVDALVAAAAAHHAFTRGETVPVWTEESDRYLSTLWYPGPDALFPNALVHTPLSFTIHGVLIDADSLASL